MAIVLTLCSNDDSRSLSSSIDGRDTRPILNTYQTAKFGFRKKKLEFLPEDSRVKPTSYRPVGDITSFENPVYESNPTIESYALPGVAHYDDDPTFMYDDDEEKKLDLEENEV